MLQFDPWWPSSGYFTWLLIMINFGEKIRTSLSLHSPVWCHNWTHRHIFFQSAKWWRLVSVTRRKSTNLTHLLHGRAIAHIANPQAALHRELEITAGPKMITVWCQQGGTPSKSNKKMHNKCRGKQNINIQWWGIREDRTTQKTQRTATKPTI